MLHRAGLEAEALAAWVDLLENLALAGFIEAYGSVHIRRATLRRHRLADPYQRSCFRRIRSIARRIARSTDGVPLHQALPDQRHELNLGLASEVLAASMRT